MGLAPCAVVGAESMQLLSARYRFEPRWRSKPVCAAVGGGPRFKGYSMMHGIDFETMIV